MRIIINYYARVISHVSLRLRTSGRARPDIIKLVYKYTFKISTVQNLKFSLTVGGSASLDRISQTLFYRYMAEAGESSSLAAGYRGGYDTGVAIVRASDGPLSSTELSSLTCASCGLLLRDPQQVTTCGHRFCRVCIDQIMIRSKRCEYSDV